MNGRGAPLLMVERTPEGLRYFFDSGAPGDSGLGWMLQVIESDVLDTVVKGSLDALRRPERPTFEQEAAERGAMLYRTLLPRDLLPLLDACAGEALRIVSGPDAWIPWEVLHDGCDFWGTRYALGRQVLDPSASTSSSPATGPLRALVLGADPRGDLSFVGEETRSVHDTLLEVGVKVDLLAMCMAELTPVLEHLGAGYDLIHFCGHVIGSEAGEPGLVLGDGSMATLKLIRDNLRGRPIVFLNGCRSARGAAEASAPGWQTEMRSVADAFLKGGALAVIGTMVDVSDEHATTFAVEFQRNFVARRQQAADAVRLSRVHCRRLHPESPSWLSFVLYGHPLTTLETPRPMGVGAEVESDPRVRELKSKAAALRRKGACSELAEVERHLLAIREVAYGGRGLAVAQSCNNLAEALREAGLGPDHEIERLYRRSLQLFTDAGRADDVDAGQIMANLGLLYIRHRDPAGAEAWTRRALDIFTARRSPQLIARAEHNMGLVCVRQGRLDEAFEWYQRAVTSLEQIGESDSAEAATTTFNLATFCHRRRDFTNAVQYGRPALEMRRKHLDPRHPVLLHTIENLAVVEEAAGNVAEAEQLRAEARTMRAKLEK